MTTFKEDVIGGRNRVTPQIQFEFHAYDGDGEGTHADTAKVFYESFRGDGVAKARGGRLAKRIGGPVDIAYAGAADWSERYITTASPSEFHSSGYRFERLT